MNHTTSGSFKTGKIKLNLNRSAKLFLQRFSVIVFIVLSLFLMFISRNDSQFSTNVRMKIIDTTTFFKENLMMEVRFNILNKYVDYFIVCESRFSHSGNKKKLYFNINDYKDFKKKIIYIILDHEPANLVNSSKKDTINERLNSIKRIAHQRDEIKTKLNYFSPNDFILHSDNDEIPNLENINFENDHNKILIFKQKIYYYKFNLFLPNVNWFGTKGCKVSEFKSSTWLREVKNKKYNFFRFDTFFSDFKYQNVKIVENGGWHFSNLKSIEGLRDKYLNDENHADYSDVMSIDNISNDIKNWEIGYDHNQDKKSISKLKKIKLIKEEKYNLPSYIKNNFVKYSDWVV